MHIRWILTTLILIAGTFLMASCAQDSPAIVIETSKPILPTTTDTRVPHTVTPTPQAPTETNTPIPPSHTPTLEPTATATPSQTPTFTPTTESTATTARDNTNSAQLPGGSAKDSVRIYLISQNTGGPLCGDSAVAIKTSVNRSGDLTKDIEAALKQLVGIRSKWVGNLYNPVANHGLRVSDVSMNNGHLIVRFTGAFTQPDDPCDNTRVRAQIWSTIGQFQRINSMTVYHNNSFLGDKLSRNK